MINRATFEFDGQFRGDSGTKVVFYTHACRERVAYHAPDGTVERMSLGEFIRIMKAEQERRTSSNLLK